MFSIVKKLSYGIALTIMLYSTQAAALKCLPPDLGHSLLHNPDAKLAFVVIEKIHKDHVHVHGHISGWPVDKADNVEIKKIPFVRGQIASWKAAPPPVGKELILVLTKKDEDEEYTLHTSPCNSSVFLATKHNLDLIEH